MRFALLYPSNVLLAFHSMLPLRCARAAVISPSLSKPLLGSKAIALSLMCTLFDAADRRVVLPLNTAQLAVKVCLPCKFVFLSAQLRLCAWICIAGHAALLNGLCLSAGWRTIAEMPYATFILPAIDVSGKRSRGAKK